MWHCPGCNPGNVTFIWVVGASQSGFGLVAGDRPGERDHRWMDMRRHAAAADLVFVGGPVYTADAARRSMVAASPAGVGSGGRPGGGGRAGCGGGAGGGEGAP